MEKKRSDKFHRLLILSGGLQDIGGPGRWYLGLRFGFGIDSEKEKRSDQFHRPRSLVGRFWDIEGPGHRYRGFASCFEMDVVEEELRGKY